MLTINTILFIPHQFTHFFLERLPLNHYICHQKPNEGRMSGPDHLDQFLTGKIAVVGASSANKRFGGYVYRTLKEKGYDVVPVNPNTERVENDQCYPSLDAVPGQVDTAVIVVKPAAALDVINDAIAAEVPKLWFQQGADFSEAEAKARLAGIETVSGKCAIMYAKPVTGIHAFHRFLAHLFKRD